MYSEKINNLNYSLFYNRLINSTEKDFFNCLEKEKLSVLDIAVLLSEWGDKHLELLAKKANRITTIRFGKIIQLYAPLYLSNECINKCVYCGFRKDNDVKRKTLSYEEFIEESKKLMQTKMKQILLVAGEHPKKVNMNYLQRCIFFLKEKNVPSVCLEIAPATIDEYKVLNNAGAECLTIYQETYNRKRYKKLHLAGKKMDYNWRLDTPERAIAGGFRKIGLGFLSGLNDWREDLFYLVNHLQYLMNKYWEVIYTLSFPRIRDASVNYKNEYSVSDRELTRMICCMRLLFNDTGLVLSTRETPKLRDGLINCGITQISAGSKTNPGGYSHPDHEKTQFKVEDTRSVEEIYNNLKELGFDPVWKDWEGVMN